MKLRCEMLEDNYKVLKKQVLVFDEKVLKELNEKYNVIKKKLVLKL